MMKKDRRVEGTKIEKKRGGGGGQESGEGRLMARNMEVEEDKMMKEVECRWTKRWKWTWRLMMTN
jgi:hypothetical protein